MGYLLDGLTEGPNGVVNATRVAAEFRTTGEIKHFIARLLLEMSKLGFNERDCFGVRLALEEAIVNGIKHGNGGDPAKAVRVCYHISQHEIITEVEDQGQGFDPGLIPDPLAPENLERPGGRGVFLMRHYMTFVQFNDRGNRVVLSKSRAG